MTTKTVNLNNENIGMIESMILDVVSLLRDRVNHGPGREWREDPSGYRSLAGFGHAILFQDDEICLFEHRPDGFAVWITRNTITLQQPDGFRVEPFWFSYINGLFPDRIKTTKTVNLNNENIGMIESMILDVVSLLRSSANHCPGREWREDPLGYRSLAGFGHAILFQDNSVHIFSDTGFDAWITPDTITTQYPSNFEGGEPFWFSYIRELIEI